MSREHLDVLWSVVELVSVDVMDYLRREQTSPKFLLGNEAVGEYPAIAVGIGMTRSVDAHVAIGANVVSPAPAHVTRTARSPCCSHAHLPSSAGHETGDHPYTRPDKRVSNVYPLRSEDRRDLLNRTSLDMVSTTQPSGVVQFGMSDRRAHADGIEARAR